MNEHYAVSVSCYERGCLYDPAEEAPVIPDVFWGGWGGWGGREIFWMRFATAWADMRVSRSAHVGSSTSFMRLL